MICGIYCLTHKPTGKSYVGQSIDIGARWLQHKNGRERSTIGAAIAKHGWSAFRADVLEECAREQLNAAEVKWIEKLSTLSPAGYNLRTGGGQCAAFSDDVRARISQATKKGLTPEVLERRRQSMRGIPKSSAWRAAMSERQKNPVNIERIAEMARNQSASTRAKIAAAHMGKIASDATKKKLSDAARADGRVDRMRSSLNYMSPATRAKMSASAKARLNRPKAPPP